LFRKIAPFVLILAMFLVDTAVLPFLATSPYMPLFSLMGVSCIGLLLGRTRGTIAGLIAGVLLDITVSQPVGLMSLLYTFTGFFSGFTGRRFHKYWITTILSPFLCYTVYEIVMLVYAAMAGLQIGGAQFGQLALRVLIETALTQLLYVLYAKILKPVWSRYANR
jgi:rod shape-determining protein MreD